MKKLMSLFLALTMILTLCACGNNAGEGAKTSTSSGLEIEVLSCSFANEVMGIDEEFSSWGFTARDGKVYVNLALKIINTSDATLTKDDFKGSFKLGEDEYELQYSLSNVAPKPDSNNIQPGCVGMVNMISLVDKSAMDSEITLNYSIKGDEFKNKVGPLDTTDALSKKTKVKAGDKFDVYGLYDVEVISCTEKAELTTTDEENGRKYLAGTGKKYVDLLVKIKNNTDVELDPIKIINYVVLEDGTAVRGSVRFEAKENTELGYDKLQPGTEEYAHLFVSVEENVNTADLMMRFNIAGGCYYMDVE